MKQLIDKKYILVLAGIVFVSLLMWNRLFRVRIPKDIPFIITDLSFIILTVMCSILSVCLVLVIKAYYFPKERGSNILTDINSFYTESLQQLDFQLRNQQFFWHKLYILCIAILKYYYKHLFYSKYIYILFHFPKLVLPVILIIEIFYMHKIDWFYILLVLHIIPLIYRYMYHSLHNVYTIILNNSDERLTIQIQKQVNGALIFCSITTYPTHYYIQEITLERLGIRDNDHIFKLSLSDKYMKEHPDADWQVSFELFETSLHLYSQFYETLRTYHNIKLTYDPIINLFVLSTYLFCWLYVLWSGTYDLSKEFLDMLNSIQDNIEPFSGVIL